MTTMKAAAVKSLAVAAALLTPLASSAATLDGLQQAFGGSNPAAALNNIFDNSGARGDVSAQSLPSEGGLTRSDLQQSMLANLDFIRNAFAAQYGPGQWDQSHAGWDLDKQIAAAKTQVTSNPNMTVDQYHDVLRTFFNSMKDYHVSVQFDNTAASTLPFTVVSTNGRYYIEFIDRTKLPEATFPFHVGDELLSFGGKSTADVVKGLKAQLGGNTSLTDQALATLFLTSRHASSNGDVQSGPIAVTVKPQGSDKALTRQLIWDYSPEQIKSPATFHAQNVWSLDAQRSGTTPLPFSSDMLSPQAEALGAQSAANPFGLGTRESYIPALGKQAWKSDDDAIFNAYEYQLPDGRLVGYVRIPSYEVDDTNAAVAEFAGLMKKFQSETQALVIDQVNNPGGSVLYMYALASMLTDQPLSTPQHHIAITQQNVLDAVNFLKLEPLVKDDATAKAALGPSEEGYPVDYEFFRHTVDYSRFIVSQWNAGKTLTDPTWLDGVDYINPSPNAQFTKPIVLLINELDFSGGDFFPATMQDNKRATLFGTRTSGAGGFVNDVKFPNNVGVAGFSMTGSIAVRADHNPIENLGVTAEVQYAPTSADLQNGFKDYASHLNATIAKILGAPAAGAPAVPAAPANPAK